MPAVILAGSCSEATRDQIAAFAEDHNVLRLTAQSISTLGTTDIPCHVDAIMCWWQACQSTSPSPCLIASSDNTSGVEAMNAMLANGNASDWFENLFAEIARKLSTRGVRRFVIAGGETSGAVVKALAVHTVDIGCEIAPGVPWIRSRGETPFELVLKSGNFGDRQFFQDALETTP
ncbi:MAG: nucleotide-binding domain containing protein [Planctomycetota bacterium]